MIATLGRLGVMDLLGHWSPAVLRADLPVPLPTGLGSVVLLLVALASLVGATLRLGRGVRQVRVLNATISERRCGDLAVIDAAVPEAVTVPGWPGSTGSIVVTSGMLKVLEPSEQAVLLAHERCHLRSQHWLFRAATRLGAALLPAAKPLVACCDHTLERWADESAAVDVGNRGLVARSIAKAALAGADYRRTGVSLAFAEGAVGKRVEALLEPRRRGRWSSWSVAALPLALALIGMATLLHAGRELEGLFDLAGHL